MKKVLEVLIFAFFISFCISLCCIDGDSKISFVTTGISMVGILVCNLFYHRRFK